MVDDYLQGIREAAKAALEEGNLKKAEDLLLEGLKVASKEPEIHAPEKNPLEEKVRILEGFFLETYTTLNKLVHEQITPLMNKSGILVVDPQNPTGMNNPSSWTKGEGDHFSRI